MATTRIMPLHVGKGRTESRAISDIIDYVANPKKTDNGRLITGYACDSRIADAEFLLAKRQYLCQCLLNQIGWIHLSFFDVCNLLYRCMTQIRKLLLCQVFFLSGFPHFLPQSSQIVNRHNHSPQVYCIVPICAKE